MIASIAWEGHYNFVQNDSYISEREMQLLTGFSSFFWNILVFQFIVVWYYLKDLHLKVNFFSNVYKHLACIFLDDEGGGIA